MHWLEFARNINYASPGNHFTASPDVHGRRDASSAASHKLNETRIIFESLKAEPCDSVPEILLPEMENIAFLVVVVAAGRNGRMLFHRLGSLIFLIKNHFKAGHFKRSLLPLMPGYLYSSLGRVHSLATFLVFFNPSCSCILPGYRIFARRRPSHPGIQKKPQ